MITGLRHAANVACVDLSADGAFAVTADAAQVVHVWRTDDASAPVRSFELGGKSFVNAAAISADGALVALSPMSGATDYGTKPEPSTVRVVDVARGDDVREIRVAARPHALAFLPDGTLALALYKSGVWLYAPDAPDAREPERLGNKTLAATWFAGTPTRILARVGVAEWRLFARGPKLKEERIEAWHADCTDDALVTEGSRKLAVRRGKSVVERELPFTARTVAIDRVGARVLVVADEAIHAFGLDDLAPGAVIPGAFRSVARVRCVGGRALVCGVPQLAGAEAIAWLVDLGASASAMPPVHAREVYHVAFLDEARLATVDAQGKALVWEGPDDALVPRWPAGHEAVERPKMLGHFRDFMQVGRSERSADGVYDVALAFGNVMLRRARLPYAHVGTWRREGAPVVDVALAADHRLVVANEAPELRVVDLVENATLARIPLPKPPQRIAILAGSSPVVVGVAFVDGTAARYVLPEHAPVAPPSARVEALVNTPLAEAADEELDRLGFTWDPADAPDAVPTERGPCELPRYLRTLFRARPSGKLRVGSPRVWDDMRDVAKFYARLRAKVANEPAPSPRDMVDLRFTGEARVLGTNNGAPILELAAIGDTGVSWAVILHAIEPSGDPSVALYHRATETLEIVGLISDVLGRLERADH